MRQPARAKIDEGQVPDQPSVSPDTVWRLLAPLTSRDDREHRDMAEEQPKSSRDEEETFDELDKELDDDDTWASLREQRYEQLKQECAQVGEWRVVFGC